MTDTGISRRDPEGMDRRDDIAAALRANYEGQRRAMVAADPDALGDLLQDDFTLTHMTGYVQPKTEWLTDVRSGWMTYHDVRDVEVSVAPGASTPSSRSAR
ncbi:nuclear transport factor 2 family protein [Georgenia sp. SUBG003]|uniref:nuclear transport factor 2 family protein n=1 Tax=Georgenia sp. SUBG003 TaxID=1497974 RepID=UPI003AB48C24